MKHTEKSYQLVKDYNRIQQQVISNVSENNRDLSEIEQDRIFDQIIKNNKALFISAANNLLSEFKLELTTLEDQQMNIRRAFEQIKLFVKMIPGDRELYLDIPDFDSPKSSDQSHIISLMNEYE